MIIQESARAIAGDMSLSRSKGMRSDGQEKGLNFAKINSFFKKYRDKHGQWDYMEGFSFFFFFYN